jgi:hypothetical protein
VRQYPDSFWMFRSVLVWFYLSYGWFGKFSKSVVEVCVHPEVLKVLMLPTLAVHTICCFDLTYTVHNVQAWAHNVSQFWHWGTGVGDTPFILSRLIALLHALIVTSTVEVHGWQTRKLSPHQTAIHMDLGQDLGCDFRWTLAFLHRWWHLNCALSSPILLQITHWDKPPDRLLVIYWASV